jgi:hypothetical protein
MYARLWWKEMRVFWPISVALAVLAAGVQGFLLWGQLPEARTGFLIVLGFVWSMLYAFAVGAGVFAGDVESKTQLFLDTMPVSRRMQWTGKVSFALATTLGLTLALTAFGALGTAEFHPDEYPLETLLPDSGLLLLEGVAWSLFWSVVLGSSLQAAVAGLMTVGSLSVLLSQRTHLIGGDLLAWPFAPLLMPRLVLAGAALVASWVVFTRGQTGDRSGWVGPPWGRFDPQFERLVWETIRESRRIWLLLAGAWFGLLLLAGLLGGRYGDAGLAVVFAVLTGGIGGGVSVFGPANRAQSYRFLAYHGARPGVVWAARLFVWGIVMTGLVLVAVVVIGLTWGRKPGGDRDALYAGFVILEAFVIAVLAGQVLRRSITAWVVAVLAFFVLVMPQFALHASSMIPSGSLALFPLLVLTISWAWTGDWMNDLRGVARWLRLGGMMGAAAVLLFVLYVGYRALSVPDIGSPFPPRPAAAPPGSLSPDQDAAPDYMRLVAESRALGDAVEGVPGSTTLAQIVANGWDPKLEPAVRWWEARRGLIEPIRRAAAKAEARFVQSRTEPFAADFRLVDVYSLLLALGLDNFERRSRGDLAGAWDDLRAAFQITNQLVRSGRYNETSLALSWRTQLLQWALVWAADPRQTPAQLRAAIADLRTLLRPVPLAAILEDEYTRGARAIRHDPDALSGEMQGQAGVKLHFMRAVIAPWWERERALRVLRLMTARQLQSAELEPWRRIIDRGDIDLDEYRERTPLARSLPTNHGLLSSHDANSLLSRAFEQVAALRIWQLEHGGRYPETLNALVPGLLPTLPPDPYSGQPFRYRRAGGQKILPLGLSGLATTILGESSRSQQTRPEQWLLYSVGPNRIDNGAIVDYETNPASSDLIFPLPLS